MGHANLNANKFAMLHAQKTDRHLKEANIAHPVERNSIKKYRADSRDRGCEDVSEVCHAGLDPASSSFSGFRRLPRT